MRSVIVRALLSVVASLVLVTALAVLGLMFFLPDLCSGEVKREFPSRGPGIAVVYVSSCGATTPFVTSVSVRHEGMPFQAKNEDVFFRVLGDVDIDVRWPDHVLDGTTRIEIVYPKGIPVIRQAILWDGMGIEYPEQ